MGVANIVLLDVCDFVEYALVDALTDTDRDASGECDSSGVCDEEDETDPLLLALTDPLYEEKIEIDGRDVREGVCDCEAKGEIDGEVDSEF